MIHLIGSELRFFESCQDRAWMTFTAGAACFISIGNPETIDACPSLRDMPEHRVVVIHDP